MKGRAAGWGMTAALAGVLAAMLVLAGWGYRPRPGHADPLPVMFLHRTHSAYNCVQCHHDSLDPGLSALPHRKCILCHVTRPDLAAGARATFHDFCESCHLARRRDHLAAGPIRLCHECHTPRPGERAQDIL